MNLIFSDEKNGKIFSRPYLSFTDACGPRLLVTSGDIVICLSTNGKCAVVGGESVMVAPSNKHVVMKIKRTVDGGFID
jgi:hypothetical protein